MTDTCCPVATLETAFRPHEVLVGALDTLAELGVITLESDIDVVAARMIAALDDANACVADDSETYDDEWPWPREIPFDFPPDKPWPFYVGPVRRVTNEEHDRIVAENATRDAATKPEPVPDEVCPFLIPFIKSEPWWTAREVFDVGGMQFAVVTGQSGHTPGLTDVRGGK